MKKILSLLTILVILLSHTAAAQTDPVKQQLDNIFLNINKSL